MKEIPINDKALMVVTDNAISFHYKTSLLDKIAFICASILAMVVLCGFATADSGGTSYFLHDVNKNVMQKTAANGSVQETYVYAPFGGTIGSDRGYIGFSSEIAENDAGMVYYNFRYLLIRLGRWSRRDPIEEQGGINIYRCLNNSFIDQYDDLGLFPNEIKLPAIIPIIHKDKGTWIIFENWYWYGCWGGPGVAAGKCVDDGWSYIHPDYKKVLAIDAVDACYKEHDLCYEKCRKLYEKKHGALIDCPSRSKRCKSKCDYDAVLCQVKAVSHFCQTHDKNGNKYAIDNKAVQIIRYPIRLITIPLGSIVLGCQGIIRDMTNCF